MRLKILAESPWNISKPLEYLKKFGLAGFSPTEQNEVTNLSDWQMSKKHGEQNSFWHLWKKVSIN